MKKVLIALGLVAALGACSMQPPQAPSESRPSTSRMNTAERTDMCTVVSVRDARLTQPYTGGNTRNRYTGQNQGRQEQLGQTIGLIGGALLGNQLGDKNGAVIGGLAGALGGAYVGAQRDANAPYAFGQEVIVDVSSRSGRSSLRTVTQGLSPESRNLYVGGRCALVGSGNTVRVIAL